MQVRAHCNDWPKKPPAENLQHVAPGNSRDKTLVTCFQYKYKPLIGGDPDALKAEFDAAFHKGQFVLLPRPVKERVAS